jgi:hypothetical protein
MPALRALPLALALTQLIYTRQISVSLNSYSDGIDENSRLYEGERW